MYSSIVLYSGIVYSTYVIYGFFMLFISPSLICSPMLTEPVLGVEILGSGEIFGELSVAQLGRHAVLFVWAGKVWIGWTGARHDRRGDASILCVLVYSCVSGVILVVLLCHSCVCVCRICVSPYAYYCMYYLFIPWYILYFSCVFPVYFLCVAVYKVVL